MNIKLGVIVIITILIISNIVIASADVENKTTDEKKWTYMMYFGGDQEWEWQEVEKIIDIAMNSSVFLNKKINFVILLDFGDAFYGYAKHKGPFCANFQILEKYDEINCGNYTTLRDFVLRCKKDYPAERYFLHIHGHGHAWYGACPDSKTNDTSIPRDILTMQEIHKALDESGGVDALEFTNCIMGNLESAYELRNCTKVYIGSEQYVETYTPAIAMLYNLRVLNHNYFKSTEKISEEIIQAFKYGLFHMYRFTPAYLILGFFQSLKKHQKFNLSDWIYQWFTMSAIRTDKLEEVGDSIDKLSMKLIANLDDYRDLINDTRLLSECIDFDNPQNGTLFDVYHFVELLEKNSQGLSKLDLNDTTKCVIKSLDEAIIAEWHQHGCRNAHGLTIFFPPNKSGDYPSGDTLNMHNYTTSKLEFTANSHWDEFLEMYLN